MWKNNRRRYSEKFRDLGRDPQVQQGLQADLRRRRDDEPVRDPAARRQRRIQQRGARRRVAAAAHQRLPEVRLDQPRAAGRLGLPAEHRGDPAAHEPAHVPAHLAGARRSHATAQSNDRRRSAAAGRCGSGCWRSALGGCASLPFFEATTPSRREPREPEIALYELEVDAPGAAAQAAARATSTWRASRRRRKADAITGAELDRLGDRRAGAGARAARDRGLLRCRREDRAERRAPPACRASSSRSCPGRGSRVHERRARLDRAAGAAHADARGAAGPTGSRSCARPGGCKPGQPFRQADWSGAKNATLGAAARRRLSDARPGSRHRARIDAQPNGPPRSTVDAGAGPLFRLGPIRDRGHPSLRRGRGAAPRRPSRPATSTARSCCSTTRSGCIKVGLFEGASVELDATGPPEAAPVDREGEGAVAAPGDVRHRLQRQHRRRASRSSTATARSSASPGSRTPRSSYGPDLKSIGTELTVVPATRTCGATSPPPTSRSCAAADETRYSWTRPRRPLEGHRPLRAPLLPRGRACQGDERAALDSSEAVLGELPLAARDLDNILAPTEGYALALQGGARLRPRRRDAHRRARRGAQPRPVRSRLRPPTTGTGRSAAGSPTRAPRPARCSSSNRICGARHDPVPRRRRRLGARLRLPHPRPDRQRRRRRRPRPAHRQRRARASAHRRAAGAARRRVRRRRQRRRPLGRPAPGVRLRRRRALPQPGRTAAPRRRLRPGREATGACTSASASRSQPP